MVFRPKALNPIPTTRLYPSWIFLLQAEFEMQKLNIYLTERQRYLLDKHNKEAQSISAFIRNILDDYFNKIANEKSL